MANQYDTNLKLQSIADAIGDISEAIEQGGGGGGGGTTVIANPTGTPTDDLDTIQIGSTIYDIPGSGGGGGGTTVIANPTGTPTDDLDTVQIGSTIYDIPVKPTETVLWSGNPNLSSIALSDSLLNYDAIYAECMFNNEAIMVNTINKTTFSDHLGQNYISFGSHANQYYGITPASTATNLVFFGNGVNGCIKIVGIKYGGS